MVGEIVKLTWASAVGHASVDIESRVVSQDVRYGYRPKV